MTSSPQEIRNTVTQKIFDSLYIDEDDLFDGDTTDLRELGLDSIRLTRLLRDFGITPESKMLESIALNPSIDTITRAIYHHTFAE